mmetsp:Transcript_88086/g.265093  ORF Transcript_88086/g.265093 Transcript_88086/m.265093 type:complete len:241 (+) Transcript_88086:2125-2847(+)
MPVLAFASRSTSRRSAWRTNPVAPRRLVCDMHDIIQRHCAAEATRGIDFSKNFRPSAHAVHLFVGMRKSTARVMPLKSLYRIWRVECGINDSLGVKLDVLVVRVVAADARPLRQEARNSREIRVRNSALDDRAGREQTARLRLSLTIGGASRACRLIKCIRVHRSACIAKSTWMRQDVRGKMLSMNSSAASPTTTGSASIGKLAGGGHFRLVRNSRRAAAVRGVKHGASTPKRWARRRLM